MKGIHVLILLLKNSRTSSLHTVIAVHEEKLARQEETLEEKKNNLEIMFKSYTLVLLPMQKKHLNICRRWNVDF